MTSASVTKACISIGGGSLLKEKKNGKTVLSGVYSSVTSFLFFFNNVKF